MFKYMNGGYVSELGKTVNGLYYSDGTGYQIPFKGDFNWFSNSTNFNDLHTNTPSYMTWNNLREAYADGWEVINHGWTSRVTPTPADTIINYPIENGGPRPLDYNYEVAQNNARLQTELGATIKHFGLPAGDTNYLQAAWDNGMKTVYTGQTSLQHNGLMNAATNLNLNNLTILRKYFADLTVLQDMKNYIDNIASTSTGAAKYWGVASCHRVITNPGNGNLSFENFKNFMDYISDTYGVNGNDSIWLASSPEIYEYLVTKQKTDISTNLQGDVLTINLDSSLVDNDLRRYALSLVVSADAEIETISYGSGFTNHSDNKTSGLINLDWGFVSLANDVTRCESLTSAAEISRVQADIDTARVSVHLLESGTVKTAFLNRLDNIIAKAKTWKVNFGNNGYTAGAWNEYGGNLTTHSALTLKDSDGNVSSNTVKIQQDFSIKKSNDGKAGSPANSGYFPDAYLAGFIGMYSNVAPASQTGIVRLGGLSTSKKYKIVIMGSHNKVDAIPNKTITVYSVQGVTQELQTSNNTNNVVVYENLSSDGNGNLDISVSKKYASWGYGIINALELTEKTETIPVAPNGLTTTSKTDTAVDLSWTEVAGATGYNVYNGATKLTAVPIMATDYSAVGLTENTAYSFTVNAVNSAGESPASTALNVTTTVAPIIDISVIQSQITTTLASGNLTVAVNNPSNYQYQFWSYQKVSTDLVDTTDILLYNWVNVANYSAARTVTFSATNAADLKGNYSIMVRVQKADGNFLDQFIDNVTQAEAGVVSINNVLVNSRVSNGTEFFATTAGSIEVKINAVNATSYSLVGRSSSDLGGGNFSVDTSSYPPGRYELTAQAYGNGIIARKVIRFNIYEGVASDSYPIISALATAAGGIANEIAVDLTANAAVGTRYTYMLSEPNRTALKSSQGYITSKNAIFTLGTNQYGNYQIIAYAKRTAATEQYDDGIQSMYNFKRPGLAATVTGAVTGAADFSNVTLGSTIEVNATASIPVLSGETIQYSFYRSDANGFTLFKDWSSAEGANILKWKPTMAGNYSIQVRAKGSNAGSYEAVKNFRFTVNSANMSSLTANDITVKFYDVTTGTEITGSLPARTPVEVRATVTAGNDLYYKYIVYDAQLGGYQISAYSPDNTVIWSPRKAMSFKVSVFARNYNSFGTADVIKTIDVSAN